MSFPGPGIAQATNTLVCDGVYSGATALSAVTTTNLPLRSTLAWVVSIGDYFRLQPGNSTGAYSGVTAYSAGAMVTSGGVTWLAVVASTGQTPAAASAYWQPSMALVASGDLANTWARLGVQNLSWQAQGIWSVDPVNGNDEATGYGATVTASDLVPLRTVKEWQRRTLGRVLPTNTHDILHLLGDVTDPTEATALTRGIPPCQSAGGSWFELRGTKSILATGTLTNVTQQSGNTPAMVEDTSIATSWTASGLISGTGGARRIEKVGSNVRAYLIKDLGSKQARINPAVNITEDTSALSFGSTVAFNIGDAYQVVSHSKFPEIVCPPASAIRCLNIEIVGIGATFAAILTPTGSSGYMIWCSSTSVALNVYSPMSTTNLIGFCECGSSGFTWRGEMQIGTCVFIGNGSKFISTAQASSGDWHSTGIMTFQGCGIQSVKPCTVTRMGTMHFWDCNVVCIDVRNNCTLAPEIVAGAGNTAAIFSVTQNGAKIFHPANLGQTFVQAWTATTSAAAPVIVGVTGWQYTDLPQFVAALDMGIYGS